MTEKQYVPFSNGSQHLDWEEANCNQCEYNPTHENPDWTIEDPTTCEIFEAITIGCITGTVGEAAARGMGLLDEDGEERTDYCWRCPHFRYRVEDWPPDTETSLREKLRKEVGLE